MRTENPKEPPAAEANILLDRLVGAEIRWVTREEYKRRVQLFTEVQGQLLAQRRKAYVIPEGGSNAVGAWGYVGCVEELAKELGDEPLTLVYAAGSGGTGAGLILGIKLCQLPWRAVGINVCDDKAYFVEAIGDIVEAAIKRWLLPSNSIAARSRLSTATSASATPRAGPRSCRPSATSRAPKGSSSIPSTPARRSTASPGARAR